MQTIKGISFPFRVGGKGGIVTTKADLNDSTHLAESIEQIIATNIGERILEDLGSSVSFSVFSPNEEATHTLIKYEIVEAIKNFEKRVQVTSDDIELIADEERINIAINFTVIDTGKTDNLVVKIGG